MRKLCIKILSGLIPYKPWRKKIRTMLSSANLQESLSIVDFLNQIKLQATTPYNKLDDEGWKKNYEQSVKRTKETIKNDVFMNEWTSEIERLTQSGESVIEIGCALGASSLYLAKRGRIVSGLDFSQHLCDLFQETAHQLDLNVSAICADVTKRLPVTDNSYDVVWHAGLIEHFSDENVQFITDECARICKKKVISMCPNAGSLAYRIGKEYHERNGTWQAGEENPKYTLKDVFFKTGLKNIQEYSIDMPSALYFLPNSSLKRALEDIYRNLPTEDDCHQGYLLVTIGEK